MILFRLLMVTTGHGRVRVRQRRISERKVISLLNQKLSLNTCTWIEISNIPDDMDAIKS